MSLKLSVGSPLGYQQITDLSSAVGLTVPDGASCAVISCETQNVRWRDDGVSPAAGVGMLLKTTDEAMVYQGALDAIEFIEASSSAKLNVTYYKFSR